MAAKTKGLAVAKYVSKSKKRGKHSKSNGHQRPTPSHYCATRYAKPAFNNPPLDDG